MTYAWRISSIKISLTSEQRESLESLLRRQKTPAGLAKRARTVLLLSEGKSFSQTSERVGLGERERDLIGVSAKCVRCLRAAGGRAACLSD